MLTKEEIEKIQTKFKIPCSSDPKKYYILCLDLNSTLPTDQELAILSSYCEFVVRKHYRYPEEILSKTLPIISGHNTAIFIKGKEWPANRDHGWAYRRISWNQGPTFSPCLGVTSPTPPPWTLIQLLDQIENLIPENWELWKKEHPAIFNV